ITKTVTTLNAAEGKYNVTFKIKGKDVTENSTTPIYAVVVFDKSGSMNCVEYSYDWKGDRYCSNRGNKWENAVKGAKDFASSLNKSLNSGETKYANIALVQFSDSEGTWVPGLFGGYYRDIAWNDASVEREFAPADFSSVNFGSADGGTNLGEGLNKALGLFTDKYNPLPEGAKKYVVVIGDGRPTYYSDENGMTQGDGNSDPKGLSEEYASKKATALKNAGVEIFSIGYDIANDAEAQRILREIASEDVVNEETGEAKVKHSVLAGEADVAAIFADLAKTISKSSAGTNATVTDNVGGKFNIVDKDGKVMTSDVLTEITEDETTILSFDIQIDPDTETGWHKTNEGFSLVYTDSNGEEQTISSTKDPEVYWKQAEYNYVVNYYKDEITGKNDSNYLGSATYKAVKGTEITENNVDKSLYMPTGYEYNKIEFGNNGETSIVITNDGTHNEINVLYTIKKFSYRVEYYKDNTLFDSKLESNILYNTPVDSTKYYLSEENIPTGYILDTDKSDNTTYTITDNNIVIKIYYKKNIYAYTVNYYFNDVYDNTFTKTNEALYGDKLYARDFNLSSEELINKGRGDYFLNPNRPYNPDEITIEVDKNNNVINVYYVNTHLVNNSEKITKTADTLNNKITSSNQVVNYEVNYKATIKNVNKGSVIETKIIDTLPYEIDLSKSNLTYNGNTGIYDKDSKTVTWTFTTTSDKYYDEYIVNKTIKYSVVYTNFEEVSSYENNTLTNTVRGITSINDNSLSNGVMDEENVKVEVKGKLIVKYLEKDTNKKLLNKKISIDKVGTNYSTNAEEIFGYNYDSVNGNENGKYSVNDTTVIYYYTKNNGEITEIETVKEGPDKVSSINGTFNYTLKGSAIVRDYVGKATLKVVDTLPYKIDENNSKLDNMCSYDGNYTITCTKEYNIKDTDYIDGEYKINKEFNLELIFIGIDKDTIVNKAKTIIDLDGNNNPGEETEKETEIEKGSLKVIYKTTDNVVLKELPETTELAGTKYSTVKESFYGYTFKENKGASVSGEYVANNTLVVYYIYTKNNGEVTENKVTKVQNNQIIDINSEYNYVLSYNGKVKDYVGEATLELIDTLPYNAEIISMDNRCNVNGKTIICSDTYNITENNNTINANFEIKLRYTNVGAEVINKVQSKLTYGSNNVTDNDEVKDVIFNGTVIATYKTEDGEELHEDITTTGLAGTDYVTNALNFYGYTLKNVTGAEKTGKYLGKETLYINYIYTKNIGGSDDDLTKEGNYEVEGINSEFNYTIKYNAVITDYVGDVTITIIDELPYKLDLSKSVFNKNVWTYDEETLTLTYTKKYNVTEKLVIDFNEELSLYYIGIDTNEVYNGVVSNLTYGEVTKDSDNGVFTKVNEGNVVVKYVTVKDNSYENLIDDITLNGLVGTTYVTNEKTFDNYVLVETIGEVEGEFALEDKEVIYVYKSKELPPKTGIMIESNNTNILSLLLVAIIGLLIRKMK
ncbi:MAG: MucBP domain-containing protein, partial [Bacilli bacterium]|nr:MucBP domain-containing protein [Bacilli bacterium]